ncbi:TauD/TfdA family dioxygenase [Acidisphaera sp. S103]|uniref:TauD/TfdA dioxygenase family protein n=1 Tax=Acidisphaera sp. S103 TaxID=1747223 RepID=UPI00131BA847|nr:TauD/TfdA family dioxygenase [Acidisphaera sp. S103]
MSLELRPLHNLFAAEASGIDLREPLDPPLVQAVEDAMDRYAVLVFRDQPLSQAQQIRFAESFGPLDLGLRKLHPGAAHRFDYEALIDISNVAADGSLARRDSRKVVSNIANQLWHSDSSFQQPKAQYSMLSAVVLPPKGGETEFADLRAAYDALPADLQHEINGLEAEHYALHSRILLGDTGYTEAQMAMIPPVRWPLAQIHPGSGRKLLFVGVHAREIVGYSLAEGRMLLSDLLEHATQRAFVYRHEWRVGDLVMWDNRCTIHRGRRYDLNERRELRRSTTEDLLPARMVA